jgi:hypothetical protein
VAADTGAVVEVIGDISQGQHAAVPMDKIQPRMLHSDDVHGARRQGSNDENSLTIFLDCLGKTRLQ